VDLARKTNSDTEPYRPSWPGKSAKRVFVLDVPAIRVFLDAKKKDVDARHKAGHDVV
jgi:hypothetical protein